MVSNHKKRWRLREPLPLLSAIIAKRLGISPVTAQLLINRGIFTAEQGRAFLGCRFTDLNPPSLLKDMDRAVEVILKAAAAGEKFLVYGDYDADGVTATALLVKVLSRLGVDVSWYIPDRLAEGYGLNLPALAKAAEAGISTVITVDCGIGDAEEARWCAEHGVKLIITDHHEPPPSLPQALAVINPKRKDCPYPFKELAGVGVTLKLAQALLEASSCGEGWREYLGLVCLGTIADIVPLVGENRIFVKHGLKLLAATEEPGIRALLEVSGLKTGELSPRHVGYVLAPRLNAAGRMGSAQKALELLLTKDCREAALLAVELGKINQQRQDTEAKVLEEALLMLKDRPELASDRVMVLASSGWHPGVIGIVASRLAEMYLRPVLLVALEGEKGKGSARSIPGFNVYRALCACSDCLLEYGGHAMACGFSLEAGRVEELRRAINSCAATETGGGEEIPLLEIDCLVELSQITEELVKEIELLEPFGPDNPHPLLGCQKLKVVDYKPVGREDSHLKILVSNGKNYLEGIGFNLGNCAGELAYAREVDVAFMPAFNDFNGRRTVRLELKEIGLPAEIELPCGQAECRHTPALAKDLGLAEDELFKPELAVSRKHVFEEADINRLLLEKGIIVEDWRNLPCRPELAACLVREGEKAVFLTGFPCHTVEVAYMLRTAAGLGHKEIAFAYGDMLSSEESKNVSGEFVFGPLKVLVLTPRAAMQLVPEGSAGLAVIYSLPFDAAALHAAVRLLRPGGQLVLLFSQNDLEENLAGLYSVAPNRDFLASFYGLLRGCQPVKGVGFLDFDEALRKLVSSGFSYCHRFTLEAAAKVLAELSLLKWSNSSGGFYYRLIPVKEKKDLASSPTFRLLQFIREESANFMKNILCACTENKLLLL